MGYYRTGDSSPVGRRLVHGRLRPTLSLSTTDPGSVEERPDSAPVVLIRGPRVPVALGPTLSSPDSPKRVHLETPRSS